MEPFALERYFARYEFTAPYLLSPSDTEPWTLVDLLARADSESRAAWESLTLGYTESRGLPALRDAIARFITESNRAPDSSITADDVLVFSCAEEAIYTVARVLVRPGDTVACVWPAYQSLYQVALECGASVRPIPAVRTTGEWDLSAEAIERAICPGTRLVIVNVPHNPTGLILSKERWAHLSTKARDVGAVLFADEVYRPLVRRGRTMIQSPIISADTPSISLGSVSKAFGLAGVRIGWVATRDRNLLQRLEEYKDYTTICASAPAEVLALIALRSWRNIVADQELIIERNAQLFAQFTSDHSELIAPVPSAGGSTCFPLWSGRGTAHEMAQRAVREFGVMVLPGEVFDPRSNLGSGINLSHRFRVGLGRKGFPEVLDRFDAFLKVSA